MCVKTRNVAQEKPGAADERQKPHGVEATDPRRPRRPLSFDIPQNPSVNNGLSLRRTVFGGSRAPQAHTSSSTLRGRRCLQRVPRTMRRRDAVVFRESCHGRRRASPCIPRFVEALLRPRT